MRTWWTQLWQTKRPITFGLVPLAWLYRGIVLLRCWCYQIGVYKTYISKLPVIIVGNITVGGTGKTPLVMAIAHFLTSQGYRVGIVSRGYGGKASVYPQWVYPTSDPQKVGDEPLLYANRLQCPVVVDPKRIRAVQALEQACDIILSDDGLQHYALARNIEIAVLDGARRLGNGFFLPAGPLRESSSRLNKVDLVVCNGEARAAEFAMQIKPRAVYNLANRQQTACLLNWQAKKVHAVAGIGNPTRFFRLLRTHGLEVIEHEFGDHHVYQASELNFGDTLPIIMTEKDAVKCLNFASPRHWYLTVEAELSSDFWQSLMQKLKVHSI